MEAALVTLRRLPAEELAARARIDDPDHPDHVPSECVLYFGRQSKAGESDAFRELFLILRQRVLRAAPMPGGREADRAIDLDVRERVLDAFQELLCRDRRGYDDRLDFYECRFNSALATLRATARRDTYRRHRGVESLSADDPPDREQPGGEAALAALAAPAESDFLFRSKLYAAISQLPPDERQVIELLLAGYPIESQDAEVETISRLLRCSARTVRNRRDRGFDKLRAALNEEEDV